MRPKRHRICYVRVELGSHQEGGMSEQFAYLHKLLVYQSSSDMNELGDSSQGECS